ncbi:hypothetical protein [Actinosynnema sp. NPDC023587]|uniref:hypothetical protein n=1 Tax=Actinosynnema sp. NPDC023587 TaxID=3154695 RepID=UPI0033DC0DC6
MDVTLFSPTIAGTAVVMLGTGEDGNRFLQALLGGKVLKAAQLAELKRTVNAGDGRRSVMMSANSRTPWGADSRPARSRTTRTVRRRPLSARET